MPDDDVRRFDVVVDVAARVEVRERPAHRRDRATQLAPRAFEALIELPSLDVLARVLRASVGEVAEVVHTRERGVLERREDAELVPNVETSFSATLAQSTPEGCVSLSRRIDILFSGAGFADGSGD